MTTPRIIQDAVADLIHTPRPVLFLDTCDLLYVMRVAIDRPLNHLEAATRLLAALAVNPHRCQPVVSFLIPIEYRQNTDPTDPVYQQVFPVGQSPPDQVRNHIGAVDAWVAQLHGIRQVLGAPLAPPIAVYAGLNLVAALQGVADRLLDSCVELERDPGCVARAVDRVLAKRRPSHDRYVKDSIHLEHCLALAAALRGGGFPAHERIVFVSANTSDYGLGRGRRPHADLQTEFTALTIEYFPQLHNALGSIGI